MLQKISISDKCCSSELIKETCSAVFNIIIITKYEQIRILEWILKDCVTACNDKKNQLWNPDKYMYSNRKVILNSKIFKNFTVLLYFGSN